MEDVRIHYRYTDLLKYIFIYENATFHVKVNEDLKTEKVRLNRGVRQGDTISAKLFTLALKNVLKSLDWITRVINIDGNIHQCL